jgi:thioesterase domain-containing protein
MAELTTDPVAFLHWLHDSIPLTAAMQIDQLRFDGERLELAAPLAPNINDKGTGFGGSIAALATLAGWCLTTLYLRRQGLDCDVVIAQSSMSYQAPVTAGFSARVQLPQAPACEHLLARIAERGRGRLDLCVDVVCDEQVVFSLQGRYVAIKR